MRKHERIQTVLDRQSTPSGWSRVYPMTYISKERQNQHEQIVAASKGSLTGEARKNQMKGREITVANTFINKGLRRVGTIWTLEL